MVEQKKKPISRKSTRMKDFATWMLLLQTRDALLQAREKELHQYGISAEQAEVLFILQAISYRPTPTDIARWMLRRPHTIGALLNRMERKGLVRKTKNSVRRNLVRVELTEKGQQAYYQATKMKSIHKVMSRLSEEEHQQLDWCLSTLRARELKELGLECKPPVLEPFLEKQQLVVS
jgi:DNA-binding MarR family transcriptional regulator